MGLLRFVAPPLPSYITSGFLSMPPGGKHVNRRSIGIFDILVVTRGCLYVGEEDRHYELTAGHALILRPDCHHYPVRPNKETTDHYWLHFTAHGPWTAETDCEVADKLPMSADKYGTAYSRNSFQPHLFSIVVPQFGPVREPDLLLRDLDRLIQLDAQVHPHGGAASWEQQQVFQRVLRQLAAPTEPDASTPSKLCAQRAASYLRQHFKDEVTAAELGEQLNFHPVYIARCMQKEYGVSPIEYLNRFRIEQAKLMMVQTDLPIARIAEEVGFRHAAYFSTSFTRYEGVTPRSYRNRFS